MSTKKLIFYIVGLGLLFFLFLFFNKKHNANQNPELFIESNTIINAYINNEKKANILYTNKLIEVSGTIKEIIYLNKKSTIILDSDNNDSGIICELNDSQIQILKTINKNHKILIKGTCKGFLKDVVFLNCYIVKTKTNE